MAKTVKNWKEPDPGELPIWLFFTMESMTEFQDLARGMPVEVAQINRSLKALWEQEGNVLTRASLINFAVYSEAPDALSANTQLMEQVTREHACRIILLAANPAASKQRVQAWISAHCHVTGTSARQVCSEQIAFLLDGSSPDLIRNILFSHLDSDLPLYLWWQGEFSNQIDQQLWSWVDRFFFDSHSWREPAQQIKILRGSVASAGSRCVLCDLNWRRLIYLRLALAQLFDHPWAAQQVNAIRGVEVTYHPEYWTTAVLFVSWIACQLGWELDEKRDFEYRFKSGNADGASFRPVDGIARTVDRARQTGIRSGQSRSQMVRQFSGDHASGRISTQADASGWRNDVGEPGAGGVGPGRRTSDLPWRAEDR